MSDKRYIIAIDSGTQSIRAVLFDIEGKELAIEQRPFEPYFSLYPGWAEQSTEDYWEKLCTVTNGLMKKITIDKAGIAGVGITTQRGTVIPMDKDSVTYNLMATDENDDEYVFDVVIDPAKGKDFHVTIEDADLKPAGSN